jgi:DNA processing protein
LSEGPHQLIKDGAMLISSGEEILEDLGLSLQATSSAIQQELFTATELRVLECMQDTAANLDSIIRLTNLPSEEISQTITLLELKGKIKNLGAQGFIRI